MILIEGGEAGVCPTREIYPCDNDIYEDISTAGYARLAQLVSIE